jgi:hypothetical protein
VRQVVSFALSAVYSLMWFLRWARDIVKNRMWMQLGWFSGLVCAGSVAGCVAWAANMQRKVFLFEGDVTINAGRKYTLYASAHRWQAAFSIMNGIEVLCFIIAKLMMLGRLTNNAARSLQEQGQGGGAVVRVFHVVAAAVLLCSVGGMVALDVAAAYLVQYVAVIDQAAAACDAQGNDTTSSLTLVSEALGFQTQSGTFISVQAILEAATLLLISSSYIILVPLSVAMFRRAERVGAHELLALAARAEVSVNTVNPRTERAAAIVDDTIQAAAEQRRRLVIACVVVLISFPARAAFDLLNAYALFDNPRNPACDFCGACQTERFLVRYWLLYTPEFRPIVVALSSPLPLFVSLWIITGAHAQAYAISLNILRARLGR